jgi:hypothetical protein
MMLKQACTGQRFQFTEKLTAIRPFQLQTIVDLQRTPAMVERIAGPCAQQSVVHAIGGPGG